MAPDENQLVSLLSQLFVWQFIPYLEPNHIIEGNFANNEPYSTWGGGGRVGRVDEGG